MHPEPIEKLLSKIEQDEKLIADLTAKNKELALAFKEASFCHYVLNAGANIVITDRTGTIIQVNDLFCNTCQYSREELIGKNPRLLSSGYHPKQFWENFYATIYSGKVWRAEVRNKTKSGSYQWLDTTVVPVMDDHGQPYQFVALRYDITQRKELETSLFDLNAQLETRVEERTRESENRRKYFQALLEYSQEAIVVINNDGNITYQSPALIKMSGYEITETYGRSAIGLMHPDDVPAFRKMIRELVQTDGAVANWQYRFRHKEGHYIWVEGSAVNRLKDEKLKACIANCRDITKRKEAEERIIKISRMNLVASRANELLIHATDEKMLFEEICRIAVYSGGFTMAWIGLLAHDTGEVLPVAWAGKEEGYLSSIRKILINDAVAGNGPTGSAIRENRYKSSNDIEHDPRMVTWKGEALKRGYRSSICIPITRFGQVLGGFTLYSSEVNFFIQEEIDSLLQITSDISFALESMENEKLRKQAEAALHQLNTELEERVEARTGELLEVNRALEAFSYSASHDLRAPVRSLLGFTEIIAEQYSDKMDPDLKQLFGFIQESGKRMNALIQDLLTLAQYGKETVKSVPVPMNKLVSDVWINFSRSNPHKAELQLQDLGTIQADLSMIEQVIINLISNAIKYSAKKEKPVISVWCDQTPEQITFYVRDNGAGFDMKNYHLLFGAFQRLHNRNDFEGTGVGLSLVKRIIEKHGGTVGAEAVVGQGATFYFTLPCSAQDSPSQKPGA